MKTKKILACALVILLLVGLLAGCKVNIDTSHLTPKPDIHAAIAAYNKAKQKKSVFSAGIKITMFQYSSKETIPISVGQLIEIERILNNDKIYMDAKLGSAFVSENFISTVNSIITLADTFDMDLGVDPEVMRYVRGETQFVGKLGYDGLGNYNGKGDYVEKGQIPDYLDDSGMPLWVAVNDDSVLNLQKNLKTGTAFTLKDFLMFSNIIDLSVNDGWVVNDAADLYYNEESQAYLYALTTSGAKLKSLILDMIGDTKDGFDEEEYAEELRLYASVIPTVSNWISTPNSTINASVDQAGRLKSLSSSMRIDINIDLAQLRQIAQLLPEDQKQMIMSAAALMNLFFVSAAGSKGTVTIRIDLTTDESFYYDADAISLENADSDLFMPVSQNVENRHEIVIAKK